MNRPKRYTVRVYLDNSIIGRLQDIKRGVKRKSKMLEEDMAILPGLLHFCAQNGIELCVSDYAGTEIEKLRSSMPDLTNALLDTLHSFMLLPVRHTVRGNNNHPDPGDACFSENRVDSLVHELENFLLSKTQVKNDTKKQAVKWDACHLAVCKDNGCQVFLTCDYASIWGYRRFLKRIFGIEIKRPVELMALVNTTRV